MINPNLSGAGVETRAPNSVNAGPSDAIDTKGLQSRSLRGQQTVIDARLHEDLKGALLVLLRHHNDQSGLCCPGQDLIAAKLGVTENTVRARLRKLEQRGLVTIHRMGRWTRYTIHFNAIDALEPAAAPVDNSLDTLNLRTRHPQNTASTPSTHDADTLKPCALTGKGTGLSTEEGTERAGAAVDNRTIPPLLDLEDPKTEDIAPPATELVIKPETLAAINAQLVAAGKIPLSDADVAYMHNQLSLPFFQGKARSLQAVFDDLLLGNTYDLDYIAQNRPYPPGDFNCWTDIAAAPVVAIAPETLAAVNAQRARHGKQPLQRADLVELGRQATLAGIAPQAAAEWILAKPTRNFFQAGWLTRTGTPTTPAAPAPLDEAARAAARARAEQVQADLVRASIAAMRQDSGIVLPPAAAPGSPRPATQQRTVTVRHAAPIAMGESGPATLRHSAEQWLSDYAAGRPFKAAQIEHALAVTGRSRDELRAQRAAAKAKLAA